MKFPVLLLELNPWANPLAKSDYIPRFAAPKDLEGPLLKSLRFFSIQPYITLYPGWVALL